ASVCGAVVLNVDYDVAPQVRYPVAHQQLHDVAVWATGHGRELRADGDRVAVGGFSAGGNLAAAAALEARDTGTFFPVLQVLGVPALDVASPLTRDPATAGSMVTPRLQRLVRATYFRDRSRRSEPYASPALARDLAGLAPAVVVTAERDALRPVGDAYAARLAGAGVPVHHLVVPGADHYFLDGDRARARRTLDVITARLSDAFGGAVGVSE
ncbi:MAG: alpha/beta hydrolase fold domain-containing protein, partial [Pseudonocardia sp.]